MDTRHGEKKEKGPYSTHATALGEAIGKMVRGNYIKKYWMTGEQIQYYNEVNNMRELFNKYKNK